MTGSQNILVIGGGGREHAICWKLTQSSHVQKIYCTPGNVGISAVPKVTCVDINVQKFPEVSKWCVDNKIDLVVVGPEDPLANGITDALQNAGILCFGPRKAAAQIEASKHFAKHFMERHSIPTAKWKAFMNGEEAKKFIKSAPFPALVVKASGLAAGKGVIVASTRDEACEAVDSIVAEYTKAGETIIVEELLEGEEASILCFTDDTNVVTMLPAQDHKRLLDGDQGPNTGGMGAYSPCPLLTDADIKFIKENVLAKTVDGLRQEGCPYVGVLYAGLILTKEGPKVLEFNCRFGDPETQILLPLLENDLYEVLMACVKRKLGEVTLTWKPNSHAVGVVMASEGYPEKYPKGRVIKGLQVANDLLIFHAGTAKNAKGEIVTAGGRVLIAVAIANELALAASKALQGVRTITFDGAHYRRDIAHKALVRSVLEKGSLTYRASGVDIDAGDRLVRTILPMVENTKTTGTVGSIGGFGGFFDLRAAGYKDPYLVSGTDGVGTKLMIAESVNIHNTIGIDLVAMCVNDILAHGAEPLFFLDYFACGKLNVDVASQVIEGVAEGCQQAGCALIGGETAEMPGMYSDSSYDLAGFAVGAVERGTQLPKIDTIAAGDVLIGVTSSGVHSNGFSLVRKVMEKSGLNFTSPCPFGPGNQTLGEALLVPTKIYVQSLLPVLRSGKVKALAHITGGGLLENIPRILPARRGVVLNAESWKIPPVFGWIAGAGGVGEKEMQRTFNCGLGVVMVVDQSYANEVITTLKNEDASIVGYVQKLEDDEPRVIVKNFVTALEPLMKPFLHLRPITAMGNRKRVGVLISGSGTNLQALIDHTQDPSKESAAEIVLVISNKAGVQGLQRAEKAGIPTKVISHKDYASRQAFDAHLTETLETFNVEIVSLAGFMRVLTPEFVKRWQGSLINIHPAILPSFKGVNAYQQALDAGVRLTGCTVHFVDEGVDTGGIIVQEVIPVEVGDTLESLQERGKKIENRSYQLALELIARGQVSLNSNGKCVWKM